MVERAVPRRLQVSQDQPDWLLTMNTPSSYLEDVH